MRILWLVAALALVGFLLPLPAAAAAGSVSLAASVNGRDISTATETDPIVLDPDGSATIQVVVTNSGPEPVTISRIDLDGQVVGLSFFAFGTSVGLTVEPNTTESLVYSVDLAGLEEQATGLIRGTVTAFDERGETLASVSTITDVQGSLRSVYGLFGLALLILTVLAIVDAAFGIARQRLSDNRWKRGLRLLAPGIGIGLVIVFTLSAFRVWVPSGERWLLVILVFGGGFFALGYLSPTPDSDEEDEYEEDMRETEPMNIESLDP
ncbi:hypothetical protein [Rhodococcus sp. NPDC058521]|uniref:hypothetical protein n=1 Tax=Rhodococcus sp. NPDC058521 TaxID=3346536 RepID=UPI00364714CF